MTRYDILNDRPVTLNDKSGRELTIVKCTDDDCSGPHLNDDGELAESYNLGVIENAEDLAQAGVDKHLKGLVV